MLLSSSHHQYPHKNNQYELVEKSEKKTSALFPLYIEQNTKKLFTFTRCHVIARYKQANYMIPLFQYIARTILFFIIFKL